MATPAQARYLEILFNDLGYSIMQRRDYLASHGLPEALADIPGHLASQIIDNLKSDKADNE